MLGSNLANFLAGIKNPGFAFHAARAATPGTRLSEQLQPTQCRGIFFSPLWARPRANISKTSKWCGKLWKLLPEPDAGSNSGHQPFGGRCLAWPICFGAVARQTTASAQRSGDVQRFTFRRPQEVHGRLVLHLGSFFFRFQNCNIRTFCLRL